MALGALAAVFAPNASAQEGEEPKLVVTIVVDRRFFDEGFRFTEASHAHARTSTAPGHATLTTGVLPARHGVIGNSWQQRSGQEWRSMYAVEDLDSPILGFEDEPLLPGRSPRTMLREGLPDWFESADEDSRRVSISRKDRAAVPMGGQNTEHVYWALPELGRFITSSYYMDKYPGWLNRFNERVMPGIMEPPVWESMVPEEFLGLVRADAAPYEFDGVHTTFPHVSAVENHPDESREQHNVWGMERPYADNAVMALAETALDELELGQREATDYLALSLSAVDRVGHQHGPFSHEIFSTVLNVDRLLGDFFALLDEEVGDGNWIVGLSADHGILTMPEYAQELGNLEAERIPRRPLLQTLSGLITEISRAGGTEVEVAERVARAVEDRGLVERAYTHHDLTVGMPADSFAVLYRNSYYPGRAWDILSRWGVDLRFGEGDYVGSQTGTNHETVYWYDRHVPMMFLGAGVRPGASDEAVYTVDFAPTLAGLAGIEVPSDLDGRRIF
jgi:hypothetical protein